MESPQVDKSAYDFARYGDIERFSSYQIQLAEILRTKPASVLEVGVGDKVVANYLTTNTSIAYTSVDIAEDVGADVIGSVTDLPFDDHTFDVVCAFEVLEHLPFEKLDQALTEMRRVAKKHVLVSIPHFGPPVKFLLKIPFLPEIRFAFKIPFARTHAFNGQHYWEVGKRGYSRALVRSHFEKYFTIEREFVPFENQYHHFYILTPRPL